VSGVWLATIVSAMVGLCCGSVGAHVVVRRMSLVGDMLSHAVLPGVVLGFLLSEERNLWVVFGASVVVALMAMVFLNLLNQYTRLKSDAAMGVILGGFFGVGVTMASHPDWSSRLVGVESFLFGQISNLSVSDAVAVTSVSAVVIVVTHLFHRPLLVTGFDRSFVGNLGYSVFLIDLIFYSLITLTIVVSVQAVGVVLVSSMLIIPAACAHLFTDQLRKLEWLAMLIGVACAMAGVWLSWLWYQVPAGPIITLLSALIFLLCLLISPNHGWLKSWSEKRLQSRIIAKHHTQKWLLKKLEQESWVSRREVPQEFVKAVDWLCMFGQLEEVDRRVRFTEVGLAEAELIVRKHRMWEAYLSSKMGYAPDHVHDDADKIEHLLMEKDIEEIAEILGNPERDPHGQPIPQVRKEPEVHS